MTTMIHTDVRKLAGSAQTASGLREALHAIETKLRAAHLSSQQPAFAIEADITAASIVIAGTTSLQIQYAELSSNQPHITR